MSNHEANEEDEDVVRRETRSHSEASGHNESTVANPASEDDVEETEEETSEETQIIQKDKENEKAETHEAVQQQFLVNNTEPTTPLEIAQRDVIRRLELQVTRLVSEVQKLKNFVSKRRQNYKRKRKEESAPRRPLSAYNIFIKERFKQLENENKKALESSDADAELKRVTPASIVAATGNEWRNLSITEKDRYEKLALADHKRYDEQMATYEPPDRDDTKKRAKTGYNMFFSAYVVQLRRSEAGVPPERGSIARLVGTAWKELTSEEKQYYEREAERRNELSEDGMIPEIGVNNATDTSKTSMVLNSQEQEPQSPPPDVPQNPSADDNEQPPSKGMPSSHLYQRHVLPVSQTQYWASSQAPHPLDGHRHYPYIPHHAHAYSHPHPGNPAQTYYPRAAHHTTQHLPPHSPSHGTSHQWTR